MAKKIALTTLIVLLVASTVFNVHLYISKKQAENFSVQGTYVAGENEREYTYLVLQDNGKYCFYTQNRGVSEKGEYTRNDDYLLLNNSKKERIAVCESDRVFVGENENVVVDLKDSDLELYINVNE